MRRQLQKARRQLKKAPLIYRCLRGIIWSFRRVAGPFKVRKLLAAYPDTRIVVGASGKYDHGWIPTEIWFLNLLQPADWDRFFQPDSIDAILAEHVWEHLTQAEGLRAARLCFKYLKPGGYIRVAVPDGLHPSPDYVERVKVNGSGPAAGGHQVLYTYRTLNELFEKAGFRVTLYEYFDESGCFYFKEWSPRDGVIRRSKRFDRRNIDGNLNYTSIVMDATKAKVI